MLPGLLGRATVVRSWRLAGPVYVDGTKAPQAVASERRLGGEDLPVRVGDVRAFHGRREGAEGGLEPLAGLDQNVGRRRPDVVSQLSMAARWDLLRHRKEN